MFQFKLILGKQKLALSHCQIPGCDFGLNCEHALSVSLPFFQHSVRKHEELTPVSYPVLCISRKKRKKRTTAKELMPDANDFSTQTQVLHPDHNTEKKTSKQTSVIFHDSF